ncbi:hypothetical protein Ngar_c33230 [Candidatus Nitrososphaera gargensis Ga9.2]|uniref:Uncharacterized protein n=1 Tax=Nitrososphaera gargensis (strain Ga9.2) TaxID=1237085 RepID=K0IL88_NITGG|nr:hypothetical protein [Candidatus Nitrososphaera gargensis]AFU60238.1 hypothetical protein Ngar_c33230 [Candidatus Nitrososphaera gargensis Ga9.2]
MIKASCQQALFVIALAEEMPALEKITTAEHKFDGFFPAEKCTSIMFFPAYILISLLYKFEVSPKECCRRKIEKIGQEQGQKQHQLLH